MLCNLCSHAYKVIKMPLAWAMLLWPVLAVGLFISYYSAASWSTEQELSGYFQAISLGMSCLVTLLCTYVIQQEQRAGLCFNMLCVGRSRIHTFFSLFILLNLLVGVGMILAAFGFYLFWGGMPVIQYVLITILMLIPLSCLILMHMAIALKCGTSWSMGAGVISLLVGALGLTGLLDSWWYYLPPVWAPRFCSLMIADVFYPYHIIEIAAELRYGLLVCLLVTAVLALLVPVWFCRWDGRPSIGDE